MMAINFTVYLRELLDISPVSGTCTLGLFDYFRHICLLPLTATNEYFSRHLRVILLVYNNRFQNR